MRAPRPDRAGHLHGRPGDRPRLRRRRLGGSRGRRGAPVDPHRRRRGARAARLGARRRGAPARRPASTCRATVEPMLPPALSDEACSLAPGVERLAVTAEIVLGRDGEPRSARFYRSRIRSDARLDYDQLDEIFAGRRDPARPRWPSRSRSRAPGGRGPGRERRPVAALEIESFEPEFEFDEDGDVVGAPQSVPQTEAHRLIEHLMILDQRAGRRAAASGARVPTPLPGPRAARPGSASSCWSSSSPRSTYRPRRSRRGSRRRQAGELAGEASRLVAREATRRGHGREAYTSLVLRSLKQAYLHAPEPRPRRPRQPRLLPLHLADPPLPGPHRPPRAARGGRRGGGRARPAAVREAALAELRARARGDGDRARAPTRLRRRSCSSGSSSRAGWEHEFEGEVSGLVGAGAFVRFAGELGDVYEGFLPARPLRGERFDLNETETALVGRRTGARSRSATRCRCRVDSVEAPAGAAWTSSPVATPARSAAGASRDRR